ncbi:MAG: hypothetical protein U1E45_03145 [Geminicoccaceae bacterium]
MLRPLGGPRSSIEMRALLAETYRIQRDDPAWARFVNNHAWALVRLQALGHIVKVEPGIYAITGKAPKIDDAPPFEPIQEHRPLPRWARQMVSRACWRNGKRFRHEIFGEEDLRELWRRCRGRCAISGLPFRNEIFGSGAARRPYAPSLDRIDATLPYTLQNCRLVLQVVNFALNAYGDEVFHDIAAATAGRRGHGSS